MCGTKVEAEVLFGREHFRSDLVVLGLMRETSLSDGAANPIVRQSSGEEGLVFEKDFAQALAAGGVTEAGRKEYMAFFIQVGEMLG